MNLDEGELIEQIEQLDEGWWSGVGAGGAKQGLFPGMLWPIEDEMIDVANLDFLNSELRRDRRARDCQGSDSASALSPATPSSCTYTSRVVQSSIELTNVVVT